MGSSGVSEGVRSGRLVRDSGSGSRLVLTCFNCGETGHRAVDCKEGGARSPNVDRVTGPAPRVRPPTGFTCHKEGHKSPDCPQKKVGSMVKKEPGSGRMASLSTAVPGNAEKKNVVLGKVNGAETRILVDTGADFGLVPRVLVPVSEGGVSPWVECPLGHCALGWFVPQPVRMSYFPLPDPHVS